MHNVSSFPTFLPNAEDNFSWIICIFILLWFLVFIFSSFQNRNKIDKRIRQLIEHIRELATKQRGINTNSEQTTNNLLCKFKRDSVLKFALNAFQKNLLPYKKRGQTFYCNRMSAEDFFNEHSLAHSVFEIKAITPALLTAVGVFGTFCGLLIALKGFDISIPELSMSKMLDGAKTAFVTSVWGVFFSILSNIYLRFSNHFLRRQIRSLITIIDEIYPANVTSDRDLKALGADDDISVQDSISDMKTSLVEVIKKTSKDSADLIASAITKHIREINENSAKIIETTLDKLNDSLNANIREQAEQTRAAGQAFVESTRVATEKIRNEFENSAQIIRNEFEGIGTSISELLASSNSDLGKWSEVAQLLSQKGDELVTKTGMLFEGLSRISDNLSNLDKVQLERQTELAEAVQSISYSTSTYKDNMERTAEFMGKLDEFTAQWDKFASEINMLKEYTDHMIKENMDMYSNNITQVTKELTQSWGNTLKDAMQNMVDGIKLLNQ